MSLRIGFFSAALTAAVALAAPALAQTAAPAAAAPAATAQGRMKACSTEWNAAKAAGKVAAGEKWQTFFKECNARLQAGTSAPPAAAAATPAPAAAPAPPAAAAATATPAATARDRMKTCSAEWNAAKAAGKVPADQKWQAYFKECNARLQAGTATAATPAAAPAATPGAAPAAAAAAGTATPQSRMKQCAAEWQALKATGKVAQGQSWQKYYGECNARLSGTATPAPTPAAATAPAAAPAKPAPAPAAAAVKPAATPPAATPAATSATAKPEDDEDTGEGVREPTPGQLAARQRMKDCGLEWRTAKEAGKIADGQTWPQYWSACNKRLKAAGN